MVINGEREGREGGTHEEGGQFVAVEEVVSVLVHDLEDPEHGGQEGLCGFLWGGSATKGRKGKGRGGGEEEQTPSRMRLERGQRADWMILRKRPSRCSLYIADTCCVTVTCIPSFSLVRHHVDQGKEIKEGRRGERGKGKQTE